MNEEGRCKPPGKAVTSQELKGSQLLPMLRGPGAELAAAFPTSAPWATKHLWAFMPWSCCIWVLLWRLPMTRMPLGLTPRAVGEALPFPAMQLGPCSRGRRKAKAGPAGKLNTGCGSAALSTCRD